MRVIRSHFGRTTEVHPFRCTCPDCHSSVFAPTTEALIEVEVNGKRLVAKQMNRDFGNQGVPYKVIMQHLQQQILREVGKELFGC